MALWDKFYPPEKQEAEFSWDQFLGGLATGARGGFSLGQELETARDTARQRDLELALRHYEPITSAAGPTPNLPAVGGLPSEAGLPSTLDPMALGIPESTAPIVPDSAMDRARARGMYAQSEFMKGLGGKVDQEMLELAEREKARKEREVENQHLYATAEAYNKVSARAVEAAAQLEDLKKQQRMFVMSGNDDAANDIEIQIAKTLRDISEISRLAKAHQLNLQNMGLSPAEIESIESTADIKRTLAGLARQLRGTSRSKRLGTR